ncbi:helix-turn-helix transcriptional regulator [Roseibium salinum]|uniref:helix-turn-helix transcriptional regulator n=1 Tax=Roseibium salinum TaxID=1604349 RepID=UPI00361032D7
MQLCARLAPSIRQSLEINRAICGLTFEKWAAEQHMLGTGTAIFVVDAAMTIHHGCREGQHLLANGTLVGSGLGRRLHFHSEEAQRRFTALARVQSKGDLNVLNSWRLADQHGQSWVCRAMGMRLGDLDETPFGPFLTKSISVILLAIKPEASLATLQLRLQEVLGLSQAEAETSLMLADGRTPAEIAASRQVSLHTVRNQIKAALAKSGCRRQSELVRKIEQIRLHGLSL